MNVADFKRKWQVADLTERSASHQHFLDLCDLLNHPKPAEADPSGEFYTFEKFTDTHGGGHGFADVYYRDHFAWEYKGKHHDLAAAYDQLLKYRESLNNPPLLVVSDILTIEVHTNFTNTPPEVHRVLLKEIDQPRSLEVLRWVFTDPEKLRPGRTSQAITADVAERFAGVAQDMRERGLDSQQVAHFLDRLVFCFFAEDTGLLPEDLFRRVLQITHKDPARFRDAVGDLFDAMATGGEFDFRRIPHFNGSLFVEGPVLEMTEDEIDRVYEASKLEWDAVDPSIFGTLFERGMDPDKRSQIGAHYTSREDIETLVEPVVIWPLQREWEETRGTVSNLLATGRKDGRKPKKPLSDAAQSKARDESGRLVRRFHDRLAALKVLDPACGSGNFLYVTLQKLKDLEKDVIVFAEEHGLEPLSPRVGPWQLYGIEISPYAYDLAQMVVWIGYLQWVKANGFGEPSEPILRPMEGNFRNMDAVLDLGDPEDPKEPEWPAVDCIVGNPPFLGGNKIRQGLGDEYVDTLFSLYDGRVPAFADLCCYWFEKARALIEAGRCERAGLLATQGIRGGANRTVLERIKESGDIFFAESDRPWVLDGANVHVSMVGFAAGKAGVGATENSEAVLDGHPVATINANLTAATDVTTSRPMQGRADLWAYGSQQKAKFRIPESLALKLLRLPNPTGRPNSDVIRLSLNAAELLSRGPEGFVIDFGQEKNMTEPARYEAPFEHIRASVYPLRKDHNSRIQRQYWWLHARPSPIYRNYLRSDSRCVVTPCVSKHRVFAWLPPEVLANHANVAFARSDDYFFGVLHSRLHEVWALRLGTRLETRPRYTPTTCFETFPFPWPPGSESADDPLVQAVADAARELNELRENWLNPPEWTVEEVLEFPGSVDGPWARYVHEPDGRGIGTVRYPRRVPDPPFAKALKKRTLTNLYNERPTWLDNAHRTLDEAVCAAYAAAIGDPAWQPDMDDETILEKLLALNLARAEG